MTGSIGTNLACENLRWGYRRIGCELLKLGCRRSHTCRLPRAETSRAATGSRPFPAAHFAAGASCLRSCRSSPWTFSWDRDSKFWAAFDQVFANEGVESSAWPFRTLPPKFIRGKVSGDSPRVRGLRGE